MNTRPDQKLLHSDENQDRPVSRTIDPGSNNRWPVPLSDLVGGGWPTETLQRFWAKVDRRGPAECWLWTASVTGSGSVCHGQFALSHHRHIKAHRFAWILRHGPIPDDLKVCHHCDVPRCVNPAHLFLGTQADNLNDARQKGRLIDGSGARKLSAEAVADIRANYRPRYNGKLLAAKYGITLIHLLRVAKGEYAAHFTRRREVA